ncbi:right-handed parallel beta-helix repeat-containing protein [Jatrophihabitans sp. YIM 134969]
MRFTLSSRAALIAPALGLALLAGTATALVAVVPAVSTPAVAAAATVQPTAANTGVPSGATLKPVYGTLVLNKAGTTYSNLDIHGRVKVTAPNITLANSIVRGDATTKLGSLVDCNDPSSNHAGFTLRDSTLTAQYPSIYQVGIVGHDFTVLRAEITRTLDGVHVVGGRVTVTGSWIHDTYYIPASQSPDHQYTHNDGVQVIGGSSITVTGNTISGNSNAALMVGQSSGVVTGVRFSDNWSSGGACTVNIVAVPRATISGLTITSNRFLHNTRVANCAILQNSGVTMTTSGNMWSDTNKAVTLTRGR